MSIAGTNAITELWAKCKAYFQAKLVSGTNIKTINNESLLGSGNISVGGGGSDVTGVKGNSESTYRTGNVNLTAANVGALSLAGGEVTGDLSVAGTLTSNEIDFSSTGVEAHFGNKTKSARIAITSSNNLRVDSSSDSGESWTTNGYAAQCTQASSASAYRAANQVLATPNGSAGLPSMRKLVATDMDGLGDTAKGAAQSAIDSATSNISTTSGTTKNLDSISLAPGTWLVTYSVEFASNATGRRAMTLTTNNTSITSTPVYMVSGAPANGMATNLSRTQVIVNSGTSNITRYLNAYQNSGSALNCRSCIQAVRIA